MAHIKDKLKVVLFLVDGLGYYYYQPQASAKGHLSWLCNQLPSLTVPNWTSILTGLTTKQHGMTRNDQIKVPHFEFEHCTLVDDGWQNPWVLFDWKWFGRYFPSLSKDALTYVPRKNRVHNSSLWRKLRKEWPRRRPDLTIVNLEDLDKVSHHHGWDSRQSLRELQRIDEELGLFYEMLKRTGEPYLIIVTSDHGGWGTEHNDLDTLADRLHSRTVPLVYYSNVKIAPPRFRRTTGLRKWLRQQRQRAFTT